MLGPVNGVDVDAFLNHFPQRAKHRVKRGVNYHWEPDTHLISRSRCTVRTIWLTTKSISASVVNRPMPNRREEWAMSSAAPAKKLSDCESWMPMKSYRELEAHKMVPRMLMCKHCLMIEQCPVFFKPIKRCSTLRTGQNLPLTPSKDFRPRHTRSSG